MTIGTLIPVGNWERAVERPLDRVLGYTMQATKKTRDEVTVWAVVLMAQSAARLTPISKTRRKIERNPTFGDFIPVWKKGREVPVFLGSRKSNPENYEKTKNMVSPIRLRGMARASWMWGISKLGKPTAAQRFVDRKGVVSGHKVEELGYRGHEITNRLSYISKIMPAGWQKTAEQKAVARMTFIAERGLTRDLNASIRRASNIGASLTR